ncbi:hypothetical protein ACE2AJ_11745 [Aquihabitans daechungensis]|uniref:hypothetical protein n=1 Tax=Aquihabitans daechungensis TaxID=1052257 RepID=UPI003B9E4733
MTFGAAAPLVLAALSGGDIFRIVVAAAVAFVLLKVGMKVLGGFARPVPAPPDPGELRRVRMTYRCSICATEVRMTQANDEVPEPPRHCMEDMDLVTSPYDD